MGKSPTSPPMYNTPTRDEDFERVVAEMEKRELKAPPRRFSVNSVNSVRPYSPSPTYRQASPVSRDDSSDLATNALLIYAATSVLSSSDSGSSCSSSSDYSSSSSFDSSCTSSGSE